MNRLRAVGVQKDEESSNATKPINKFRINRHRVLSYSPWDNYASSVYLPAINPTASVKQWVAAHSDADQQLRLIADLFDRVQREVISFSIKYLLTNHMLWVNCAAASARAQRMSKVVRGRSHFCCSPC